jgi:hypothetical protein
MSDAVRKVTPSIYVLSFLPADRFLKISREIEHAGWVSEALPEFKTTNTGRLYAAVILDAEQNPTHLCRLVRRQRAAFDQRSVGLSDLEPLSEQERESLREALLSAKKMRREGKTLAQLARLTPAENAKVIQELEGSNPALAEKLRKKGAADDRILSVYSDREREVISLERDAVGLVLDIAFSERDQLPVASAPQRHESFLSMLSTERYTEDEFILFDKDRFPGLKRLKNANPKIARFVQGESTLSVIHANRTRLEHTLGVDLIYISDHFGLLVGVQYKVLSGAVNDSHFTADANFEKQVRLMRRAWKRIKAIKSRRRQVDYRLSSVPFYFKFVARLETNFSDDKLCPGMYLPFDLVEQMRRRKPAEQIGRRHGTRHLSNTEFASLIREGWIGTTSGQIELIQEILTKAFKGKRSVIIAIQKGAPVAA